MEGSRGVPLGRTATIVLVIAAGLVLEEVVGSVASGGHSVGYPSGPERGSPGPAPGTDCRACLAGHPNFCRLVSGLFTRPQLPVGYNLIAQIPRGACNINITEMKHSRNFLSLRHSGGGAGILNGNWAMDWSGDYSAAGTTFTYHRHDPRGGPKAGESITAPGPSTVPVDLLLVVPNPNPNPGIRYQYFLPVAPKLAMSGAPVFASLPTGPQVPSEYDGSNRVLPGGANGRPSLMEAQGTSNHHYRGRKNRPPQRGSHLDHPLPFQPSNLVYHQPVNNPASTAHHYVWRVSEMTPCSKSCGGGKRRTVMSCVRETNAASSPAQSTSARTSQENPAEGSSCDPSSPPQETVVRCNVKPCPAEWVAGDWGPCSVSCGEGGTQTREIWCEQEISATLRMRVTEGACLSSPMPRTRKCPNVPVPCQKRRWITSEWNECSVPCGEGVRRRNVHCTYPGEDDMDSDDYESDGNEVVEEDCPPEERPPEEEACDMGSCSKDTWFFTEWSSKCSSECGSGIRTRHVHCSGAGANEIPGSGSCDPSTRPPESMACSASTDDCPQGTGSWFAGPWSKCSSNVNCLEEYKGSEPLASQTRDVVCITASEGKFEVVAETNCSSSEKPISMRSCGHNTPSEPNYREYEYESLDTWNNNADADAFNSSLPHCAPEWYMTEWTECSKSCGAGEQSREVKCLDRNQNPALGCNPQQRPSMKQECNVKSCSTGHSHHHHHHHHRHPPKHSASNCKDEYKNCALVVQARLCHYNYYRNACCHSCGLKS